MSCSEGLTEILARLEGWLSADETPNVPVVVNLLRSSRDLDVIGLSETRSPDRPQIVEDKSTRKAASNIRSRNG